MATNPTPTAMSDKETLRKEFKKVALSGGNVLDNGFEFIYSKLSAQYKEYAEEVGLLKIHLESKLTLLAACESALESREKELEDLRAALQLAKQQIEDLKHRAKSEF